MVGAGGLLGGGCAPQLGPSLPCTPGAAAAAAGPVLPFAEMASLHSPPCQPPYSPLPSQLCSCYPCTTVVLHPSSSPACLAGLRGLPAPGRCRLHPFARLSCHASGLHRLISYGCCRGYMASGLARCQGRLSEVRHAASAAGPGACCSVHVTESSCWAAAAANLLMIARVDWRLEAERAFSRQSLKGMPPKN